MNPYKKMFVLCEEDYNRLIALDRIVHKQNEPNADGNTLKEFIKTLPKMDKSDEVPVETPVLPTVQAKKFKCTICNKTYNSKRELRRHFKIHLPKQALISPQTIGKPIVPVPTVIPPQSINKPETKVIKPKVKKPKVKQNPFKFTITKWKKLG